MTLLDVRYLMTLVAATTLMTGCGSARPESNKLTYSGTATFNGQPIEEGKLTVYSDDASIDAADIRNGQFVLSTEPGEKRISVTAMKVLGTPEPTERIPNPSPVKYQIIPKTWNANSKFQERFPADPKEKTIEIAVDGKELPPPKDGLKITD